MSHTPIYKADNSLNPGLPFKTKRWIATAFQLEKDLFEQSLDTYYNLKSEAFTGNPYSKLKLEKMGDTFTEALASGEIMNYN